MLKLKKHTDWHGLDYPKGTIKTEQEWSELMGIPLRMFSRERINEYFEEMPEVTIKNLGDNEYHLKVYSDYSFRSIIHNEVPKLIKNYFNMLVSEYGDS